MIARDTLTQAATANGWRTRAYVAFGVNGMEYRRGDITVSVEFSARGGVAYAARQRRGHAMAMDIRNGRHAGKRETVLAWLNDAGKLAEPKRTPAPVAASAPRVSLVKVAPAPVVSAPTPNDMPRVAPWYVHPVSGFSRGYRAGATRVALTGPVGAGYGVGVVAAPATRLTCTMVDYGQHTGHKVPARFAPTFATRGEATDRIAVVAACWSASACWSGCASGRFVRAGGTVVGTFDISRVAAR